MLIKYGLECKINLSEKDQKQTKKINYGKGIFYKVIINESKYDLFQYLDVEVKIELKGFHKIVNITIV